MRKYLILILVFLIPTVLALEECGRFIEPVDVPCTITSSWKPLDGCNKQMDFYNETGGLLQWKNWTALTPFCNMTWNISKEGTYIYNSSIEDGVITIGVDDMILASVIGLGIAALFFLFLGYKLDDTHFLLKILFAIVGLILVTLIPVVLITHDVSVIFHTLMSRLQIAFWIYILVYLSYRTFKYFTKAI